MTRMAESDWYALLKLRPDATTEEIAAVVEKRSRQASAMANTHPERSQQLREQVRAIKRDLLSGPEARAAYDAARMTPPPASTELAPTQVAPPDQYGAQPGGYASPPATYPPEWVPQPSAAPPARGGNRFLRFMQSGYTCTHCGESYLPGAQYCTQCCARLVPNPSYVPVTVPVTNANACPYCGTVAATTHRFCRNCGASRPTFGG